MRGFLLMIGLLASMVAMAQPPDTLWTRTYGGGGTDEWFHAEPAHDGGYLLAGSLGVHYWVAKTDSHGVLQWSHTYGTGSTDRALYSCEAADGSVLTIGIGCLDQMNCGTWFTRTSATGDSLARVFVDRGVAEAARRTSDGGFIIPGSIITSGEYGWLVKSDSAGAVEWSQTYSDINEENNCVAEVNGGYILGGKQQPGTGFLRWVRSTGESVWRRSYHGAQYTHILGVVQTTDGGFAFDGFSQPPFGSCSFYLQRTSNAGDSLRAHTYGATSLEAFADLVCTPNSGFLLAGFHSDSSRAVAVCTDSVGNTLWMQTYARNGTAAFTCITQTADGGYLLGGQASNDGYLVRLAGTITPTIPLGVTVRQIGNDMELRWAEDRNPFYRIYSSPTADGPFTTLEGSTSLQTFTVPMGGDTVKFFAVVGWDGR